MRPVEFGEALADGGRLTLFSLDKPDRFLYCHQVLDGRNVKNRTRSENGRSLVPG
jgi:hypothetical protein